jgi:hypothetical protein
MSEERKERCETCRWWAPDDSSGECMDGTCHRYPPVLNQVGLLHTTQERAEQKNEALSDASLNEVSRTWNWSLPVVEYSDFCGEWRAKQSEPAEQSTILIRDLGLSTRARRCLRLHWQNYAQRFPEDGWPPECLTTAQLCERTAADLNCLRNCGAATIREIRQALANRGLYLKGEQPVASEAS